MLQYITFTIQVIFVIMLLFFWLDVTAGLRRIERRLVRPCRLPKPPQPILKGCYLMENKIVLVFELPAVPPNGSPVRRFAEATINDETVDYSGDIPLAKCRLKVVANDGDMATVTTWTFDKAGNQSAPSSLTQVAADTFPPPEPPQPVLLLDEVREAVEGDTTGLIVDDVQPEPTPEPETEE